MDQQLDMFDATTTVVGQGVARAENHLPPVAQEILKLVGPEALIRLVNLYGGTHIDFPRHARHIRASKVVQHLGDEIGEANALRLASHFSGVRLHVPKCDKAARQVRDDEIRAGLDKGEPAHALARRFKLTERQIWAIAKKS
jgi:hypothetical protein